VKSRLIAEVPFQINFCGQAKELRLDRQYGRLVMAEPGAPETAPYRMVCDAGDEEKLVEQLTFLGINPFHRQCCAVMEQAIREKKAEQRMDRRSRSRTI
jgi:hypothetical protein